MWPGAPVSGERVFQGHRSFLNALTPPTGQNHTGFMSCARLFLGLSFACLLCIASAQMTVLERNTTLSHSAQNGYGSDTFSSTRSDTYTTIQETDYAEHRVLDARSGNSTEGGYSSEVELYNSVSVGLFGTALGTDTINGLGTLGMHVYQVGPARAALDVMAPGNSHLIRFAVTSGFEYRFRGELHCQTTDGSGGMVTLEQVLGDGSWSPLLSYESTGYFDDQRLIGPGEYRIRAAVSDSLSLMADGGADHYLGYSYSFAAVPEPGTWLALGLGGLALVRRRHTLS